MVIIFRLCPYISPQRSYSIEQKYFVIVVVSYYRNYIPTRASIWVGAVVTGIVVSDIIRDGFKKFGDATVFNLR